MVQAAVPEAMSATDSGAADLMLLKLLADSLDVAEDFARERGIADDPRPHQRRRGADCTLRQRAPESANRCDCRTAHH